MNGQAAPQLEHRLREGLTGLRPTTGAPASLVARVTTIPETVGRRGFLGRLLHRAGPAWAATLAAAAVLIGIAYAADRRLIVGGPGGAPNATGASVPFDATLEGPGILVADVPVLPVVAVGAALVILVLGMRWALRWHWHNFVIRAAPVVAVAVGVAALGFQPGFADGGSYGPSLGYDLRVEAAPGSDGPPTWYSTAEPGGPIVVYFTVRNPGPLPIRLEGLVEQEAAETPLIPRWTAVWLAVDANAFGFLSNLRPFEPTVVDPEEYLQLYLVGRAGACAYGPGYTLEDPLEGWSTRDREVTLVYSVLGLTNQSKVELPMTLVEPYRQGCTG